MFLYFIPPILLYIGQISFRRSNAYYCFCVLYIVFFLCFGYMCGSDWRNYEMYYEGIDSTNLILYLLRMEPGYVLLMYLSKILGIGFWEFAIFFKCVLCIVSIHLINKYAGEKFRYIGLIFYFTWFAYYLYIDAPFRNSIAAMLFLLSIPLLEKRKTFLYFCMAVLAFSIHTTAIFMVPLYWIYTWNLSMKKCIFLYVLTSVIFLDQNVILSLFSSLFSWHPIIYRKLLNYSGTTSNLVSLGYIYHIFFLVLFLYSKSYIETKIWNGRLVFNFAFINFLLYRIGLTFLMGNRFMLYISVFYCVGLSVFIVFLNKRSKLIYTTCVVLFSIFIISRYLSRDSRYVPYSNYLYYSLFVGHPSYEYRDQYNDSHSPYEPMKSFEENYGK